MKLLHVLFSFRTEGSPRLALELCRSHLGWGDGASVVSLVDTPRSMHPLFEEAGVEVLPVLGWSGRDYFGLRSRALEQLSWHDYDGVICYGIGPHIALGWAARRSSTPMVVHIGNAPPRDDRIRRKIAWQLKLGDRWVHRYAACSDYVRDRVVSDYGLQPASVVSIPNGIRLEHFASARRDRSVDPHGFIHVGMVGSFETHKDQLILIRAVAAAKESDVPLVLTLVGEGANEVELRAEARRLGVDDLVMFAGPTEDVRSVLARIDVFAYAVTDQEGLGIALVEALAAGVPVVASDVGASREVLDRGVLGTLVARRDPQEWASALQAAKGRDPVAIERLERYSIARASAGYRILLE